jgi:hypothetical protein
MRKIGRLLGNLKVDEKVIEVVKDKNKTLSDDQVEEFRNIISAPDFDVGAFKVSSQGMKLREEHYTTKL